MEGVGVFGIVILVAGGWAGGDAPRACVEAGGIAPHAGKNSSAASAIPWYIRWEVRVWIFIVTNRIARDVTLYDRWGVQAGLDTSEVVR